MNPPKRKSRYLSPKQLAKRWGISPKTLANMRVGGTGPAYTKVGGCVRYPLKAIKAYEAAHTARSTVEHRAKAKAAVLKASSKGGFAYGK